MSFGDPREDQDRTGHGVRVVGHPTNDLHGPYLREGALGVLSLSRSSDVTPLCLGSVVRCPSGVPCVGAPPEPASSSVVTRGPGTVSGSAPSAEEVILPQVTPTPETPVGSYSEVGTPGVCVVVVTSGTKIVDDVPLRF